MKVLRITPELCTGCMRCELACSYMQTGTFQPAKSVIRISPFEAHTSYAPYTCTQCAEAWCLVACPVEAIYTEYELPVKWLQYADIDALWYRDPEAARAKVAALKNGA